MQELQVLYLLQSGLYSSDLKLAFIRYMMHRLFEIHRIVPKVQTKYLLLKIGIEYYITEEPMIILIKLRIGKSQTFSLCLTDSK